MASIFDEVLAESPVKAASSSPSIFDEALQDEPDNSAQKKGIVQARQKSIFDEVLPSESDFTPSGKPAYNDNGTPSQAWYEEVYKNQSVIDSLKSGVKHTIEGIKKLPENLRGGRGEGLAGELKETYKGALVNLPEAALAATEDYVSLAGAAKDQLLDKAGRLVGKGEEWERKREYDRWIERQAEGQRRAEGKSRLGDVFRAIGDVREAEDIDKTINQDASNTLSLVADPTFLLSGGSTGALRTVGKAAFIKGVEGTIGAERAARIAEAAKKAAELPVIKQGVQAVSKTAAALDAPSALALEAASKTTGLTRKTLENVVAPALEYVGSKPLLSSAATSLGTLAATGDAKQSLGAGLGVLVGSQLPIAEKLLRKQGALNKALATTQDILTGSAKSIRGGGGRSVLIRAGREASDEAAAQGLKVSGGLRASDIEGVGIGKLIISPTSFIARRIIDPSLRGAAVGGVMGYAIEGTAQGAAEMAGQGLVVGPFGHAFDKAVGQIARPGIFKTNSQVLADAKNQLGREKNAESRQKLEETIQSLEGSGVVAMQEPETGRFLADPSEGSWKMAVLQNPETLARMEQANQAWLGKLPEASRNAIQTHRPDTGVLYKIGDAHDISTGQLSKETTAEQNQFNVYRAEADYNAIQTSIGGEGTAGSSQSVSDAMANAQNSAQAVTDPSQKASLDAFVRELEGYGGSTVKQPDGTYKASGSKRTLNLINTSTPAFQSGSNVFHEVLGHGTFSLTGEEGSEYSENIEAAKQKVISGLIGMRDAEGNLVKDAQGKPLKTGLLGENLEKSILEYAALLPEQARKKFLESTQGKTAPQIAEEMFSEVAGAFGREAPTNVSEHAQRIGRPNMMQRVSKMLNLRQWLKQKGVAFIDSSDITGSFIFKDANGEPLQLNDELRGAFAELVNLQNEAQERLSSSRSAEDPGTTVSIEDIKVNPSMAQEFLASGYIKTRTKTSWELAAEAKALFVENEKREPTPDELKKTLDEGIISGAISVEAPQFTGSGEPIINKPSDIRKADKERTEAVILTLDSLGGDADPNALRKVEGPDGKSYYAGSYLSENQLKSVEALSDKLVNRRMKSYLRMVSEHLRDPSKKGTPFQWLYYAATRGGKYSSSITQSFRVASPTSMHISKANNFLVNMFDHSRFSASLSEAMQDKPTFFKLWGDVSTTEGKNQAVGLFLNNVEQYLSNHENGVPGAVGLHAEPIEAAKRARAINDFFNIKDKDTKHLKAGEFPDNQFYRKLRFDRVGDISEGNLSIQGKKRNLPINLKRQKEAFMPVSKEDVVSKIRDSQKALWEKEYPGEPIEAAPAWWLDKHGNLIPVAQEHNEIGPAIGAQDGLQAGFDAGLTRVSTDMRMGGDAKDVYYDSQKKPLTVSQTKTLKNLAKEKGGELISDNDKRNLFNFMPAVSEIGFYSQAEANVQKLPEKFTVAQLKASLSPEKGVKPDELAYTGFDDFISGKKPEDKLTKAEVHKWISENKVDVQEVVKSDQYSTLSPENNKRLEELRRMEELTSEQEREMVDLEMEATSGDSSNLQNAPRFTNYQIPGGVNSKELLLTLPLGDWYYEGRKDIPTGARSKLYESPKAHQYGNIRDDFNRLAQIRFNERTGPNGEKILFIEEVQSDWHQKGRKEGYGMSEVEKQELKILKEKLDSGEMKKADSEQIDRLNELLNRKRDAVPDAPFKKSWHELAMKRMLKYAADNGFDKVAWTTGEQQAARYDLSKQLSKISALSGPSGRDIKAGEIAVAAWDKSGQKVLDGIYPPEKLPDVIGKELAEKITSGEAGKKQTFEGLDLKVGGSGMKGFYDKILPELMNKLGKKLGFKTGEMEIFAEQEADIMNGEEADSGSFKAHSIDITPAAKETVKQGQPLFMPSTFNLDGKKIERLKDGDIVTGDSVVKAVELEDGTYLADRVQTHSPLVEEAERIGLKVVKSGLWRDNEFAEETDFITGDVKPKPKAGLSNIKLPPTKASGTLSGVKIEPPKK